MNMNNMDTSFTAGNFLCLSSYFYFYFFSNSS